MIAPELCCHWLAVGKGEVLRYYLPVLGSLYGAGNAQWGWKFHPNGYNKHLGPYLSPLQLRTTDPEERLAIKQAQEPRGFALFMRQMIADLFKRLKP